MKIGFKDNLKKLRKDSGLSQYELADKLGCTRGQLANYEQGSREPKLGMMVKIADFFGVTTDELVR